MQKSAEHSSKTMISISEQQRNTISSAKIELLELSSHQLNSSRYQTILYALHQEKFRFHAHIFKSKAETTTTNTPDYDAEEMARRQRIAELKAKMYASGKLKKDVPGQPHAPVVIKRLRQSSGNDTSATHALKRTKVPGHLRVFVFFSQLLNIIGFS